MRLTVSVYIGLWRLTSTLRHRICNTRNSLKIGNYGIAHYHHLDGFNKQQVPDLWIFWSTLAQLFSHLFCSLIHT